MAGLYFHIPFCKSRCYYCDFYSCTSLAKKPLLLQALAKEMELNRHFETGKPLKTLYFGGGTPSLCTPDEIASLIRQAGQWWDLSALEEVTFEANPDDLSEAYLTALRETGVNRLSIGIQSLRDEELKWMHRRHDAASAIRAIQAARKAGFDNLTVDLIYGLPGMTLETWKDTLLRTLELGIEHLSAYHLSIEPKTVFGRRAARGELSPIDEQSSRAQFDLLHDTLNAAGFEHYEISNFARPGRRAIHNSAYWFGEPYLGLGPSAHSYDGKSRRWNHADLNRYLSGIPQNQYFEIEILSDIDRYNEYLMTRLRTDRGVDLQEIEDRFGACKSQYFRSRAAKFLQEGLMLLQKGKYRLSEKAFFISDGIISDLFLTET